MLTHFTLTVGEVTIIALLVIVIVAVCVVAIVVAIRPKS